MSLNRTSEWIVMTISISRGLPLFNFERLNILCAQMGPPLKSFDHLNFPRASVVQFRASLYVMRQNRTSEWKVMTIWIAQEVPLFNFERLDIYTPESDIRMKSYDHFNFSRASVVLFRASRYVMRLNRTSEWKFMNIWISQEQPLFNNQCLDILCTWIGHPSDYLWPFELLNNFHCSIWTVSIYYAP